MVNDDHDLSARARRQALSAAELREFELELESSAQARLFHRVGREFDAEDVALPGDQQASQRVVARLLGELPNVRVRSRARFAASLLAAAVLVASVAGATVLGVRLFGEKSKPPASAAGPVLRAIPEHERSPSLSGPTALDARAVPTELPAAATPAASAAPPSEASSNIPAGGPAELLSAAGQARRQGHSSQAIALLNSLQARFPNSAEARASDISLGMLQLKGGSSSAALPHFDRYLQRSPRGPLASEALWGRAQALFAQGKGSEARRSLSTLLEQYPNSPHSSAARAKLRLEAPSP